MEVKPVDCAVAVYDDWGAVLCADVHSYSHGFFPVQHSSDQHLYE